MAFTVIWTDKSRKNLEKLPKDVAARIIESVESLRDDPFLHVDRLAGSAWYKYRSGTYRVILDIKRQILVIFVIKAGLRKRLYRDL
jgi:mRNA interferase RelE/StbE